MFVWVITLRSGVIGVRSRIESAMKEAQMFSEVPLLWRKEECESQDFHTENGFSITCHSVEE